MICVDALMSNPSNMRPESAVKHRYAAAAKTPEAALCCPIEYNRDLFKIIPEEVIVKDYGCGDPSRYLRPGETVLDLGDLADFRGVWILRLQAIEQPLSLGDHPGRLLLALGEQVFSLARKPEMPASSCVLGIGSFSSFSA